MDSEQLANNLKKLLSNQHKYYFETLENADSKFIDSYWKSIQNLYKSLDMVQKENLKDFLKMCLIETTSEILAYIDDIARFENQREGLKLYHGDEQLDGDIQDHLLMDIEDNGFFDE